MRGFPLRFDPPHNQHRLDLLSFLKFLPHGRPVPTIQFFNLLPNRLLVDSFAELHFADARDLLGGQVLLKTELLLPYLSQIFNERLCAVGSIAFGRLGGVFVAESDGRQRDCPLLPRSTDLFH